MESFVLPGINDERRRLLDEAGIPYSLWEQDSVLIGGEDTLQLALNALNATIARRRQRFEGLIDLTLQYDGDRNVTNVRRNNRPGRATPATQAESRQNYIQVCANRLKEVREAAKRESMPVMQELSRAQSRFVQATRRAVFIEGMPEDEMRQRFAHELEQIRLLDKVTNVHVLRGGLLVNTETLYTTEPSSGTRYEIGKFAIWVRFIGENAGVYWINQTRTVNGVKLRMHAPYVYNNGMSSNDEVRETMLDLIGRLEFAAVTDLAIQYVETVNEDNPLTAYLDKWPRAEEAAAA
jgi:hypothetical protein